MAEAEELVKKALESEMEIGKLDKEIGNIQSATDKEIEHLKYYVYQERIRNLERERDLKIDDIYNVRKGKIETLKNHVKELHVVIAQIERIVSFLRLPEDANLRIEDGDVKAREQYHKPFIESMGYVIDDQFLKVKLFIVENKKPKNKYSLIALGHTIFNDSMVNLPRRYVDVEATTPWACFPEFTVKEAATVEELRTWLKPHWHNILSEALGDYPKVKAEYLLTKKSYHLEDFRNLAVATCPKCNYFYIRFDNISLRDDTTCPRCHTLMAILPKGGEH